MMRGEFIISLDFELHWGRVDKIDLRDSIPYFENTRTVIPKILQLFNKNNIHATWATVGMLFLRNLEEWKSEIPELTPSYLNKNLSVYKWANDNKELISKNNCHFAPELTDEILKVKGQELASHTFSHYYCLEKGQILKEFEHDLKAFKKQINKKNAISYSLVFPRNQFNHLYLKACKENEIKVVRTNPDSWFWNVDGNESLIKKICRTLDCYLPLIKTTFPIQSVEKDENSIVLLPASRFFKPVSRTGFLNKLRLYRIKKEMTFAAKNKQAYHLWWHPHNFGNFPEKSLNDLNEIINHYQYLSRKYGMQSSSMMDTYNTYFKKDA